MLVTFGTWRVYLLRLNLSIVFYQQYGSRCEVPDSKAEIRVYRHRFRLFSRFRFFSRLFFCIEFPLIWKSPFLPLKSILGRQSCHVWLVRAGNFAARVTEQKNGATINSCLVLRPHYSARPMRLWSRGPAVRLRYVTEIDREGLRRRRTATG